MAMSAGGKTGILSASVAEVIGCAQRSVLAAPDAGRQVHEPIHSGRCGDIGTEVNGDGFDHDVFEVVTVRNQCAHLMGILLRVPALKRKSKVNMFILAEKSAAKIKVGFFRRPHDTKRSARAEDEIFRSPLEHMA